MSSLVQAIPAGLWLVGMLLSFFVINITVVRSRYGAGRHPVVRPVTWGMVGVHLASLLCFIASFAALALARDGLDVDVLDFYARAQWPALVVVFVCVLAQDALMYLQARRAMRTQMDETLGHTARRVG